MVDDIALFFTSNLGNIICCAGIFIYGSNNLFKFYKKNQSIHIELEPVLSHLKKFETAEEFPEYFYEFQDTINQSPLLKNAWREFTEVLINPSEHPFIDRNVIVNTKRPQHFFSESSIVKSRINMQLVHAVANKLTGLGLLGTFIGLVAGIYLASSGIASNSIEEAKQALSYLLHGASTAFWTSIVGLAGSMVFSSVEKRWSFSRRKIFDELNELLEARLEFLSAERLNNMILEESRKQSNSLSSFATDLAINLGQVMSEQVSEPIGDILVKINMSLDTLNENQSKAADETIERLIKEFSNSISGAAGKEMQAFASTIQDLSKELRDQMGAMNDNYHSMQENTKNTINELSNAFSEGANQIKQEISTGVAEMVAGVTTSVQDMTTMLKDATAESAENMRTIATQFDESISKLRDSATEIAEITENNKTFANEITQLLSSLGEVHSEIQSVVEPIVETVKSLATSSENLGHGITLLANTSEQTTNAVTQFNEVQQEIAISWRNYEQRFNDVDTALGRTLESLQQGYISFADSTTEYLQGMNYNAAQIVEKLSGAVLELRESLENLEHLPSSVNKLETLPTTVSQLDNSLKHLPQLITNLSILLKDVPEMVQTFTRQLEISE